MKPVIKYSIILTVILIIGMAIGFEISEIFIKKRIDEPVRFRRPEGFRGIFEEIIGPSEQQQPIVDSILLKYHTKIDAITKRSMDEISLQMDSLKTDLEKVLDDDQVKRLNEEMTRMKMRPRQPPPGGMRMRPGPGPGNRMPLGRPNDPGMRQGPPPGNRMPPRPPDNMRTK